MSNYAKFLESKQIIVRPSGIDVSPEAIHAGLKPHQRDIAMWGARRGRYGLFARTGLGKTRTYLESMRHTCRRPLVVTPLGVARQTVDEAAAIGMEAVYARTQADAPSGGVTVTNYEMVRHFDPDVFDGVVLDEGSILKDHEAKTRARLTEMFSATPYRIVATATPSPNDPAEIGNYAEFLGIMTRGEMLATFFVNAQPRDERGRIIAGQPVTWQLRGHARGPFYRWLSTWAISLKYPSDLGYPDDGYILPELGIHPTLVPTDYVPDGQLFATGLKGVTDRARVRKSTVAERVAATVRLIDVEPHRQWVVWCGLNAEQDAVTAALGARCISVTGSMSPDDKIAGEHRWRLGDATVLVTKPSIFGHGMNWQHCARMAFVGLSDSFEQYHQAIRRVWRFGQTDPVDAHVVLTDLEEPIYRNVLRKEREFEAMTDELVKHVSDFQRAELAQQEHREQIIHAQPMRLPAWLQGVA